MSETIYQSKISVSCPLVHDENEYYHLVYKVTNTVNGKVYVGKHTTKDPYDEYFGSGKLINEAIKKYGIENFTKEILYCFIDEKEAYLKEEEIVTQEFIDREDTYNITLGGCGWHSGKEHPMYGMTGEHCHNFGKHHTQEAKDKLSKAHTGKTLTEEHKRRIAKALSGKNLTEDHKKKLSKARKGKYCGENNPNFGKPKSQETRDKISKANMGHPGYGKGIQRSQETRDKISKAKKGKPSPLKGTKRSNITKEKISKSKMGELNPTAKSVLKIDELGNIIIEYKTVKECCIQEQISNYILKRLTKEHILYNGFYFEYKSND